MSRTLQNVKVKDLKHLAFLTGCQLSTTKAGLQQNLITRLNQPLVNDAAPRVVSVDMGIRNLAFCVVDLGRASKTKSGRTHVGITSADYDSDIGSVTVSHWQKLDLLAQLQHATGASTAFDLREPDDTNPSKSSAGVFTPPIVSQIALKFVRTILDHRPSTILIERQRFRSGGGSAIQEWTVRVNMLESMLWACLATVRQLQHAAGTPFPSVHSVEPARVAKFWTVASKMPVDVSLEASDTTSHGTTTDADKQRKVTKAQRIAILRQWMLQKSDGLSTLDFAGQAQQTLAAFANSKSRAKVGSEQVGKLDDLTDCLLQAMAWVRWESNRRSINALMDASDGRS